jgi:hypothetical protein
VRSEAGLGSIPTTLDCRIHGYVSYLRDVPSKMVLKHNPIR